MMEEKDKSNIENKDEQLPHETKRKRSVWGWAWRAMVCVGLFPVVLFVLLSVLLYLPPVQKAAVDMAAEYLSEEMDMEVSVENVRLRFPFDLTMGGMVAVQDGDTVLNAGSLDADVRLIPLFDSKVEVDGVCLRNVRLNTRNLVEACLLKGVVGELGFNSHSTSLSDERAVLSKVWLKDADLLVVLADSVSEDTTESEPVNWKVCMKDIRVDNAGFRLRSGVWDADRAKWVIDRGDGSLDITARVGDLRVAGMLDLKREIYDIDKIRLGGTALSYSDKISLSDVSAEIDSVRYKGSGELRLAINDFAAREKCGMHVTAIRGHVEMSDSLSVLFVPDLIVETSDSRLSVKARMDMNAFDSICPGTLSADVRAQLGKGDILASTVVAERFMQPDADLGDVRQLLVENLPAKPVELEICADGNMENLTVGRIHAFADRLIALDATASITDACQIAADARATVKSAKVKAKAEYNMETELYMADVVLDGFRSAEWVRTDNPVSVSGSVKAHGRGMDFYSPRTMAFVEVALSEARMGKMNFSSTRAEASLRNCDLDLNLTCDNEVLQTAFELTGKVKRKAVDANLVIDLPLCDVHGMGLYDDTLTVSTQGVFSLASNLDNLFKCDAHVDGLDVHIGGDSLTTHDFDLSAETTLDSTYANLKTGDLLVDFNTPYNLFKLSGKFDKLISKAQKQVKERELDIDALKAYLPELCLVANIGNRNPLSAILSTYGVSFDELTADVDMGPEKGVVGNGHLYRLKYDVFSVDTTFFDIHQDNRRFVYRAGVACADQSMFDAFKAYVDGYFTARDAEAHLTYFDKNNDKGLDLGVHAHGADTEHADTLVHFSLFPSQPVIGYRKFRLNDNNFVNIRGDRHIDGDVRLESLSDDCRIALTAGLNHYQKQWANAVVDNLNLGEIVKVLPFMPRMTGMFYMDAMFNENENNDNFWAGGTAGLRNFTYEEMEVGNIETDFDYQPEGKTMHNVQGQVMYNGVDVAYLNGSYNSEGDGYLNASLTLEDIPVELFNPFIPNQVVSLDGNVAGVLSVCGPADRLVYNGDVIPADVHVGSDMYSVRLALANDTISIKDSKLMFDKFKLYGAGENPITINGNVDFSNMDKMAIAMSCYGKNFKLIEAKRTGKSMVFGDVYADFFSRISGTVDDLRVRGMLNVLSSTNVTYIMTETPLSQGDRLDDIVTFVDFSAMEDKEEEARNKSFVGVDLQMTLNVEDGAKFNCEFSADRQSYVNIQGGGSVVMKYTPEGVLSLQGRLTVNEGEMKYTLPVIPLKTFVIENGSYIEFTGEPFNPTLNIAASERTKATVSGAEGASRSVAFDVGMKISNTLENMGLEFTIEAPEDIAVQNELAGYSKEEKNKLAVALLCTGMYLSNTNANGFSATNALNNFLQNEINNIAGRALATTVNVEMGMEQTTRDDGSTRTDYSFKFSKRFFSDRLNVVIGGKVSSDGSRSNNESGAYIDDVSLEWRLDDGGSRYVRLFHEKDYSNLIEGELDTNGAGLVLRKKVDRLSELFVFGKPKSGGNAALPGRQPSAASKTEEKGGRKL